MAGKILDVCYEQADISIYEIGSSNLSHVKKIISLLDSGKECMKTVDSGIVANIDSLIDTLNVEKTHYTGVADMQKNFYATIRAMDEEMSTQLSKVFNDALQEESSDKIYKNINMFKTLSSLSILDGLNEQELNALGNAFILKGLLENSSSTDDVLIGLKKLYDEKKISKEEYEDLADYIEKNAARLIFDSTKHYVSDSISAYLATKATAGVTSGTLWNAFQSLNSNLNDTLISASLVKSTDDLLSYSVKFNALKDTYISFKEQAKSVAFSKGVGFVTTVITAAELWGDFNYDMNTIEMSNTESYQNLANSLIEVGFVSAGGYTISYIAGLIGVSGTVPLIGVGLLVGPTLLMIYDNLIKVPVKEKLREFDDWREQLAW